MIRIALAFCALMLGACTVPGEADDIRAFVLDDLRAAHASAEAHGDTRAAQCWAALIEAKEAAGGAPADIKGVFSGIQAARNVRRGAGGMSDAVVDGCGAMILDGGRRYSRLAKLLGGV